MNERIERVSVRPMPEGPITGLHVRCFGFMGKTMIEVVINRNYSLESPVVELRASTPMNLFSMPSLASIIWNLGQELEAIAHEWEDEREDA